jgi:hypothetical protein
MSQTTIPSTFELPPAHGARHYGRAVFAAVALVIAIAVTLLVIAWTHDGTAKSQTPPPPVTRVAPTWNTPECPRIGYC